MQLAHLMTQASTTSDATQRAAIYREIQLRLNQVGPFVTMFQPAQIVATQKTVTGFHYNYIWQSDFNLVSK
jgi:ABC-type transport system substrate-binding protein